MNIVYLLIHLNFRYLFNKSYMNYQNKLLLLTKGKIVPVLN
jgi:hypothetical protein